VIPFNPSGKPQWTTTICGDCDNLDYCNNIGVACLPLEMLRQLSLASTNDQISMVKNLSSKFEY